MPGTAPDTMPCQCDSTATDALDHEPWCPVSIAFCRMAWAAGQGNGRSDN